MRFQYGSGDGSRQRIDPDLPGGGDLGYPDGTLTGPGGLALFSRYVRNLGLCPQLEDFFGGPRKSRQGLSVHELSHQLFCFLMDGTSRHLVHFDTLKEDEGSAGAIETAPNRMASSHAVKRFFRAFQWGRIWTFRRLLRRLFLWRLRLEEAEVIVLGIDHVPPVGFTRS